MDGEREREALELEHEELTDRLEYLMLLLSLRYRSSALLSAATRRPRMSTRIRSRPSRLSRPYPPPAASAPPVGLLSPGREAGLTDTAAMDVVKFFSAYWVWMVLSGLAMEPQIPPCDFNPGSE